MKVHRKGIIVTPAEVRRRLGIVEGSYIELVVEENGARIIIPKNLRQLFGVDGEKALKVLKLMEEDRRRELEKEVRA